MGNHDYEIAVLVPCFNEAKTIVKLVRDFQRAVPHARIYVYDNNSSDETASIARAAGAEVRHEPRQGKGFVVRRMFAEVDADIYVLVDGDGTYDAAAAGLLVDALVAQRLDMVVGAREAASSLSYPRAHVAGNRIFNRVVKTIFGAGVRDMLSGYRAFSRRFVRSFPSMSRGFEIETEMTIHALELEMPMAEIPTRYVERQAGSESKLRTVRDGLRVAFTIVNLFKQERPMLLFNLLALALAGAGLVLGVPVVIEFAETGLVPRFPTAILASGLMILAALSLFTGLTLDTVTRGRRETKRLFYLAQPALEETRRSQ